MFHEPQHHRLFEKYISPAEIEKYHLKREDLPFSAPFRPHEFRFPRQTSNEMELPGQQYLGTRLLKIRSQLPLTRKKNFSARKTIKLLDFKTIRKEIIFSQN